MSTTRTRKSLTVGGVVAALVAGGAVIAAQLPGQASSQLILSPTSTTLTTLNFGQALSGQNLPARIANATTCLRVRESKDIRRLRLDYLSYTDPADVDPSALPGYASLSYRQVSTNAATVPSGGWRSLVLPTAGNPPAVNTGSAIRANGRNVCLTANVPGTYSLAFVDPGEEQGTDDDVRSQTITLTVKDAYQATQSALSDDWKPALTTSPTQVALRGSLVGKLASGLTQTDSRGSSAGIGVLGTQIAKIVGLRFVSLDQGDALDLDLNKSYLAPDQLGTTKPVTVTGTRDVPAVYRGYTVLRHIGSLRAVGSLDKNGNGTFTPSEDILRTVGTAVTQVVTKLATPQAVVSELIVKPKGKGNVWVHVSGTKGTWKIYRNGGLVKSGTGSYIGWSVTGVPKGTQSFTAKVSAAGYVPAEQTVTVTVS